MSSAAVGTHSGAGPLSLMSCVRESSPLQDYVDATIEHEKNAASKRRFWNPKKWFKRKNKHAEDAVVPVEIVEKDVIRSRSTSELSITEDQIRRRSGSSMHPGLSVSHDSVFHSPNSGSDLEIDAAHHSSSSLSISQPLIDVRLQTELSERLRSRRGRGDTSEDDEGLPHSPCNSPTTIDTSIIEKTAHKDLPQKSHSSCSDGSLLSMASSEMDEDSLTSQPGPNFATNQDAVVGPDLELAINGSIQHLNHSAAHHRVSVRPKRRAPHRGKRATQLSIALPTTLEVNEDLSIRSLTPEHVVKDVLIESTTTITRREIQEKCSSLPPGLVAPTEFSIKLNRSRSNASQDFAEEDFEKDEKNDKSFFDRIFPRRSAKKRKSKEEKTVAVSVTQLQTKQIRIESKPIAAPRAGPGARQRVQPIDLPVSPDDVEFHAAVVAPAAASPLQVELEERFKQRQVTPPPSPKLEIVEAVGRMKVPPGLSSLQQRVLQRNDEVDEALVSPPVDVTAPGNPPGGDAPELEVVKKTERMETTEFTEFNNVTISGPSHTAVVNVTTCNQVEERHKDSISVTKIQLKSGGVPEFFNRQLNKVGPVASNVVFSTVKAPEVSRKFSQEDIEILEKTEEVLQVEETKTSTLIAIVAQPRFKKHEPRKSTESFESLKAEDSSDRSSSQDSLDNLEDKGRGHDSVVLRKKSLVKHKTDDEPELMKVFARRSLKLKDSDVEAVNQEIEAKKTRDSDKENQESSPEERRKSTKPEIQLRRPNNFYTRTFSAMAPKPIEKQASFSERRKTDNWINNDVIERSEELLISPKKDFLNEDLLTERKNFNQRKAEWEKRAQDAQKKSVP